MTTDELRIKCRTVMLSYLKSKGYPKMTRREILAELLPMWKKLDENGLVEPVKAMGGSFQQFQDLAVRIAQEEALMEKFDKVGNIFKKRK